MSSNPVIYLWKYEWRFSEGNRKNVVLYIALSIIANLIMFLQPLLVAFLLNTVQEQGINKDNVWNLIGIISCFVFLIIAFWTLHGPSRIIERKNAFLVRANYKKYLVDGVLALPPSWHTDHHSGETIDKIEKGTDALYRFSGNTFEIIEPVIKLVSSYFALIYFNLHAAYIVFFIFIIAVTIVLKYDQKLGLQYKEIYRAENKTSQKVYDVISNITTVIILRIEKLVSKEIVKKIFHPFALYKNNIKINEVKWFFVSLLVSSNIFFVLGSYILINVFSGKTILIGTLYALYGYTDRIGGVFFRFASKYSEIVQQKSAVENAEEVSKDFLIVKDKDKSKLPAEWQNIAIKHLSFSYHGEGHDLNLNNIDFTFSKGERIALVGASGSGKTTFLKLIRNLYPPKHAEVYIDNIKIGGLKTISNQITLIPQDPELFATTIKENITMGIEHNLDYVKKYSDLAEFSKVVPRLPKKWNSSVNEKGVNLSGGEKQRLALARGLMACEDKDIVLMDEPTSSVDSGNELEIYQNIFKNFKDKTVISTVHRLHLLPMFDKIYLFDKGKIIASGNLEELIEISHYFRTLWEHYKLNPKIL